MLIALGDFRLTSSRDPLSRNNRGESSTRLFSKERWLSLFGGVVFKVRHTLRRPAPTAWRRGCVSAWSAFHSGRLSFCAQKHSTSGDDGRGYHTEYDLSLNSSLNQRSAVCVLGDGSHVDANTSSKAGQGQNPEDQAERPREPLLQISGLMFEMEVD